eukprot:3140027-Alexandrium_andersonii.AAC.1
MPSSARANGVGIFRNARKPKHAHARTSKEFACFGAQPSGPCSPRPVRYVVLLMLTTPSSSPTNCELLDPASCAPIPRKCAGHAASLGDARAAPCQATV